MPESKSHAYHAGYEYFHSPVDEDAKNDRVARMRFENNYDWLIGFHMAACDEISAAERHIESVLHWVSVDS